MRGKGSSHSFKKSSMGITPAYAGKSIMSCSFSGFVEDHPRLCGEKKIHTRNGYLQEGSPPPMRGKVQVSAVEYVTHGITPAYAGKSRHGSGRIRKNGDHPRLCGEKFAQYDAAFWEWGSPPPMRGKVSPPNFQNFITGITPAYAGKRTTT